ncbi:MAG: putative rane protein of ExoQ family [Conexibacter sp.]|nr:putative rane protein of ExoQ family [Conexibacter sp.]
MTAAGVRWEPQRIIVMAVCLLGIVLATTGLLADHLFAQPTTAKYFMTVIAPTVGALTCLSPQPLRVVTAAAIVLGPFSMSSTLRDVTLSPLGILLAAGGVLALFRTRAGDRLTSTSLVMAIVLALLAPAVLLGSGISHYVAWLGGTFVAGWVAFVVAQERGGRRFVLSWVVIAGLVQAVLAIFESTRGVRLALHSQGGQAAASTFAFGDNYFRPAGAMPDPISLGNVLAFVLPLGVSLAATAVRRREGLAWTAVTAVIALALLLTYSRLSWVGGILGVGVAVVFMPPRMRLVTGLTSVAGLVLIVVMGLTLAGPTVRERFSSIADPTARTNRTFKGDRERQAIWHSSVSVFRERPATGTGFGNLQPELGKYLPSSPNGLHAHSVYLQILAASGIAGAAALLLLLGHIALAIGRGLLTDRARYAGYAGAFFAMLVPWLTDTTARYAQVTVFFAFCFGAMLAARARREPRQFAWPPRATREPSWLRPLAEAAQRRENSGASAIRPPISSTMTNATKA